MANDAQSSRKMKDDDSGPFLTRLKKGPKCAGLKKMTMNARTYKALFKSQRRKDALQDAASPPSPGSKRHNYVETCMACSKRQRLECDLPKLEVCSCNVTLTKDPCGTSIPKGSIASSSLKDNIVRKELLAPTTPIFGNKEEEKMFLDHTKNLKGSDSSKGSISVAQDVKKERVSRSAALNDEDLKLAVEERPENQEFANEQVLLEKEQAPKYTVAEKDLPKSIKRVQIKCEKLLIKLLIKQKEESEEFSRVWEGKKIQLEKEHKIESALVRSIYTCIPVRTDKLKILDIKFAKKLEDLKCRKEKCLKDLLASQLAERNEERQKAEARWLAELKSLAKVELVGELPPNSLGSSGDGSDNVVSVGLLSEEQIPNGAPTSLPDEEIPLEMPETALSEMMGSADSIQTGTFIESNGENDTRHETDIIPNVKGNENDAVGCSIDSDSNFNGLFLESDRENDGRNESNIIPSATGEPNEAAGSPINGDLLSMDLSSVNSTLVQPVITPVQGGQLPQDLALWDEGSQLLTSTGKRDGDALASGNKDIVQQVEIPSLCQADNGLTVQNTNEAPINEPVSELQTSSSNHLSIGCSQPDLLQVQGVEHQTRSEGYTSAQNAEASSQLFEDPAEVSNHSLRDEGSQLSTSTGKQDGDALASGNMDIWQQVEIPSLRQADNGLSIQNTNEAPINEPVAELQPSSFNHLSIGCSQPDLLQVSGVEHQTCAEGHTSAQNAEAPSQLFEDPAEASNHALWDEGSQLSAYTGKRDGDALASGNKDIVQQVEIPSLCQADNGLTVQNTNEAPINEPVAELQPSSSNHLSIGCSQPDLLQVHGVEHQTCAEGDTSAQNAKAPSQLVEVEIPSMCQADNGLSVQNTNEAPIKEPVAELQPSSFNHLSIGCSQPDLLQVHGVEHQTCAEGHTSAQNAKAPSQLVEDPAEVSNHAVLRHGATLELHPPINATNLPLGLNQLDVSLASRVDTQPSSEGCTQTTEGPPHLVEHTSELPNQAFLQPCLELHPPIDTHVNGFARHLPVHITSQVTSGVPSLYADPLQNELQRLCKEKEQVIKIHEDTKLQLRSICHKETEEIIAEIRRKYSAKLQDAEAAFLLKKKELDRNHDKVLMNKIFAEAFRCTLEMQQVVPSSFVQALDHLSSHPASRPSHVTGSSLVGPPATSQKTTAPPVQVQHASALFSSTPIRLPNISSIRPPTGNYQVTQNISSFRPPTGNHQVSQIRSAAPHLQSFRPSTNIAFLPRGMPSQRVISDPPTTSLPVHYLPPQPPSPACHTVAYNRPPRPEIAGGMPNLSNYLSALELLMEEVDDRPGASLPNLRPPL